MKKETMGCIVFGLSIGTMVANRNVRVYFFIVLVVMFIIFLLMKDEA